MRARFKISIGSTKSLETVKAFHDKGNSAVGF